MPRRPQRPRYTFESFVLDEEFTFQPEQQQPVEAAQDNQSRSDDDQGDYFEDISYENAAISFSSIFSSKEDCVLLSKSHDGREAHFLTPQYDLETRSLEALQYGFLGLRFVKVAGNDYHLVSFCRNQSCPDPADDGSLYEMADFAKCPAAALFGGQTTLCTCAVAHLQTVGGPEALKREIQQAEVPDLAAEEQSYGTGHRQLSLRIARRFGMLAPRSMHISILEPQ